MTDKSNQEELTKDSANSNNELWPLFISFTKIGAFTFGGGWAMISIIEREIVDKHGWIKRDEFLDLLALAQSLPGILAVNISVAVGDKMRGVKGSMAAALGSILPSLVIILLIAIFLTPDIYKKQQGSYLPFYGYQAGSGSSDSRTSNIIGKSRKNHHKNTMDPCSGSAYDISRHGVRIQSHSVYHARCRRRMAIFLMEHQVCT